MISTDNPFQLHIYSPYDVDMSNPDFDWVRFREQLERGPALIKEIMFDPKTALFLKNEIAVTFGLFEQQAKELSRIVREVLLSNQPVYNMANHIQIKLGVGSALSENITSLIISRLFLSVGNILEIQPDKFRTGTQSSSSSIQAISGQDLPETDGNIIDLRNNK